MAFLLEWLRGRGPDWRPRRTIEADVANELAFHLEEATDEGVRSGMTREAARAAALARFGDVDSIRQRCVAIREGGGASMVKLLVGAVVALIALSAFLVFSTRRAIVEAHAARAEAQMQAAHAREAERVAVERAQAAQQEALATATDPKGWLTRFRVEPDNWRLGWAVSQELVATLSADDAAAVMFEVFPKLSVPQREQVLKPFVFHGGHPRALDVLDLALADPDAEVRARALGYLRSYAFVQFADGDPRYESWRAAIAPLAPREVSLRGLQWMAERLLDLEGAELNAELDSLAGLDLGPARKQGIDVAAVLAAAGLERVLESLRAEARIEVGAGAGIRAQTLRSVATLEQWLMPAPAEQKDE